MAARRQRALVLALSEAGAAVPVGRLLNLDPGVPRAYASVSRRTLLRDVSALAARGFLRLQAGQASADRARILAFLPWWNEPPAGSG